MNTTLRNILSNVAARVWAMGIGIVLVPIYTNIIGMEAYGLVGFYGTLLGSLGILDLGLSSTLSRELARAQALYTPAINIRNLVFSLECIYWLMGLFLGLVIVLLSPYIAFFWVKGDKLPTETIQNAVMLMGGIITFQWPQSIYSGGLIGLQKQVSFNLVNVLISTIKNVGVLLVLKFYSPTVLSFFTWQILTTFISVLILRKLLWDYLPKSSTNAIFSKLELQKVWKFAAGMTGISLATFCLAQIDKIVLSKLLSLENYGYYTLAWTIGTSILMLVGILGSNLFPRVTEIVAKNNTSEILIYFHRYNRLMASTIVPIGLFLVFFSREIISIWTQNNITTENIWLAVSILTLGSVCNSFMHLPYYLMLAYGDTKFTIYQNIIASIILTPLLFWWTNHWGLTGATLVWFVVNFGYNIISLPLVHHYLPILRGELKKTYLNDIGIILLISFFFMSIGYMIFPDNVSDLLKIIYFIVLLSIIYLFNIISNSSCNLSFCKKLKKWL